MKKTLIIVSIISIAVIAGSIFYYFVIFLPQQSEKISNTQVDTKGVLRDINDQINCELQMLPKLNAWLDKKCTPATFENKLDPLKQMDCRIKAMSSSEAQQFSCLK